MKINLDFTPIGVVGVIFVVLKLMGIIGWSWLWVVSPFWIGGTIFGVILGLIYKYRN